MLLTFYLNENRQRTLQKYNTFFLMPGSVLVQLLIVENQTITIASRWNIIIYVTKYDSTNCLWDSKTMDTVTFRQSIII
jgi:TRAP-type uncharacterized transport system fused permease subunit